MPAMYLAGLPIPGPDVLELARLIDDQVLAEKFGNRVRPRCSHPRPGDTGTGSILRALDDPPTKALAELRATLLQEHVARVRGEMA